jgi:hypothetical protein
MFAGLFGFLRDSEQNPVDLGRFGRIRLQFFHAGVLFRAKSRIGSAGLDTPVAFELRWDAGSARLHNKRCRLRYPLFSSTFRITPSRGGRFCHMVEKSGHDGVNGLETLTPGQDLLLVLNKPAGLQITTAMLYEVSGR